MPQNFYNYCLRDEKEAEAALDKLLQAEKSLADKSLREIFGYARDLKEMNAFKKFLDPAVVAGFLSNPQNPETKSALVRQLLLLYVAGGGPLAEEVLSPEEFLEVASGAQKEYRIVLFVRTLGKILSGELDYSAYEEGIIFILSLRSADFVKEELDLAGALTVFLALAVLWQNFLRLSELNQDWLINQYLHLSFASGIEANKILDDFVRLEKDAAKRQEKIDLIGAALAVSEEEVPAVSNFTAWKKLSEIIQTYALTFLPASPASPSLGGPSLGGPGKPDGYKQEEFLRNLYKGESGAEILRRWLRPVLQLVFLVEEWQTKDTV